MTHNPWSGIGSLPTPKLPATRTYQHLPWYRISRTQEAKQAYHDQWTRAVTYYSHSHLDIHDDTSTRTRQNRPFKK